MSIPNLLAAVWLGLEDNKLTRAGIKAVNDA
jgi:hypothetical protein